MILNDFVIHSDENNKIKVININYLYLKQLSIINWKNNRPADSIRINEIYQFYIINNISIVPGILYVWFNNNQFHIYDGSHRYEAAKLYNKEALQFIIHINYNTNDKIIEDFKNINKSISVPDLYFEEETQERLYKESFSQNLAKLFCDNYPKFVSITQKPKKFNFNRDHLVNTFSKCNINFKLQNIHINIYESLINGLNIETKEKLILKNIKLPTKCHMYNFYIFYNSNDKIIKYINNIYNN